MNWRKRVKVFDVGYRDWPLFRKIGTSFARKFNLRPAAQRGRREKKRAPGSAEHLTRRRMNFNWCSTVYNIVKVSFSLHFFFVPLLLFFLLFFKNRLRRMGPFVVFPSTLSWTKVPIFCVFNESSLLYTMNFDVIFIWIKFFFIGQTSLTRGVERHVRQSCKRHL